MPFDHFNIIANLYDRAGEYKLSESLLKFLTLSTDSRVLDAGGGTGRVALALRGMVHEVFVVDIAWGMVRRSTGKGLPTIFAPIETIPFASASFDRILMMDVLHHVFDQKLAAHELWRILAPQGRILVVEPDIRKLSVKLVAILEKLLLMRSNLLNSREISSLFSFPNAKVTIYNDSFNLFVTIEKGI